MYGNYRYSLTSQQQSSIQVLLRLIPKEVIEAVETRYAQVIAPGTFELLHDLTYAESWTPLPQYPTQPVEKEG